MVQCLVPGCNQQEQSALSHINLTDSVTECLQRAEVKVSGAEQMSHLTISRDSPLLLQGLPLIQSESSY